MIVHTVINAQNNTLIPDNVPVIAVKTNALGFPFLEPNIGIEVGFNRQVSIGIEGYRPRFHGIGKNNYRLDANLIDIDVKYWPQSWKAENAFNGHFIGAFFTTGFVDLEAKAKGNQAEVKSFGLEYGYLLPLAKKIRLELSLGIGTLRADYDHYKVSRNKKTLLYSHSGRTNWWGPTKASVSLVWVLSKDTH